MAAIFTHIYADITPEFQELCSRSFPFSTVNVIQKVCDMTGAVFVQGRQPRLAGNWQTMKTVHDLLSGLVLYHNVVNEFDTGGVSQASENFKKPNVQYTKSMFLQRGEHGTQSTPSSDNSDKDNNEEEIHREDRHVHPEEQHHGDVDDSQEMCYRDVHVITLTEVESDSEGNKDVRDNINNICENNSSPWHSPGIHNNDLTHTTSEKSVVNGIYVDDSYVSDTKLDKTTNQFQGEPLTCSECNYVAQCSRSLHHHKVRVHLKPWKCRSCNKGFGLQKELQHHYKSLRSCRVYKKPQRELKNQSLPFYTIVNQASIVTGGQSVSELSTDNQENRTTEKSAEMNSGGDQISRVIKVEPFDYEISDEPTMESCSSDSQVYKISTNSSETATIKQEQCEVTKTSERGPSRKSPDNSIIQSSGLLDAAKTAGSNSRTITIQPHQVCSSDIQCASPPLLVPHTDSAPADRWQGDGASVPPSVMTSVNVIPMFLCSSCDYKADTKKKVDDHVHRVHFKRFQCLKCPALFGLQKDLTRHYRKKHKMIIESQRRGRKSNNQWPYTM